VKTQKFRVKALQENAQEAYEKAYYENLVRCFSLSFFNSDFIYKRHIGDKDWHLGITLESTLEFY
jgi:hypothetical protein